MTESRMVFRPPKVKEESHIWIIITIILLLAAYSLLVHLSEPLKNYVATYTDISVITWLSYILFFWLLGALWLAYRKWQDAIDKKRELEAVVSSINPDALLIVSPDNTIQSCNPCVKKLFLYDPEEVINNKTDFLYYYPRSVTDNNEVSKCLTDFGFHVGSATGKCKDGTTFPLEVITADLAGQPGAVVLARDITERKQAEEALRISHEKQQQAFEELQQTQAQVIHQERLRVLGQMASYIAHEFNNSLTPIMGLSEFLLSNFENIMKKEEEVHRCLTDINTAANDAAYTVSRLREFYKTKQSDNYEDLIDLNKTIEDSISLTRPKWKDHAQAAGKDVEFDKRFGQIPKIQGSEEEMHEVFTNLIFNAVNAMAHNGKITITTEAVNNNVVLTVTDQGRGMTETEREQCFEPFYSTNEIEGSGLGLVVVKNVVERHNGSITCDSRENEGTTFTITLPQGEQQTQEDKKKTQTSPQSLHILAVDDEELVRRLLFQFLEIEGHSIEMACNGKEAKKKINSDDFDLLITDWAMPEMNGAELIQSLREENTDLPIVLTTGFGSEPYQGTSQTNLNADVLLAKPITQENLKEAVNNAVQKKH